MPFAGPLVQWVQDTPVLAALTVLLVALSATFVLHRMGRSKGARWTLGLGVACAVATGAAGMLVESPARRLARLTGEFVAAIEHADERGTDRLLAPSVEFRSAGKPERQLDRAWLLSVVRGLGGAIENNSVEVTESAVDSPGRGRTSFVARTVLSGPLSGMVHSSWELRWRGDLGGDADPATGGWRVASVECLTIENMPAGSQWVTWAAHYRR